MMSEQLRIEQLGDAWVGQATGVRHAHCEDRFRMLTMSAEMVVNSDRGEVYAVFDGMGSLPRGAHAAQHLADRLFDYYEKPEVFERGFVGMSILLEEAADEVAGWQTGGKDMEGGCAGVVVLIEDSSIFVFSAGDCEVLSRRDGKWESVFTGEGSHLLKNHFGLSFEDGFTLESRVLSAMGIDRICCLSDGVAKAARDQGEDLVTFLDRENPETVIRDLFFNTCEGAPADDWTLVIAEIDLD